MNCKPNDLAMVCGLVDDVHINGALVTVLHLAPNVVFRLPDGARHCGGGVGRWVVDFGRGVMSWTVNGSQRLARYGVVADRNLRPIRDPGEDAVDETLLRLPAPKREKVTS